MDPFEEVFETHRGRLFAYLLRMTRNRDTACDILQESVGRCLERYGRRNVTPALLFTIARNAFLDHTRRNSRLVLLDDDPSDPNPSPEHDAIVQDRFRKVLDALQALSPEERDILSMVASSEFSYEQIAKIQGTTVSNIKVKVHRARIKLRQLLEGSRHERA